MACSQQIIRKKKMRISTKIQLINEKDSKKAKQKAAKRTLADSAQKSAQATSKQELPSIKCRLP